MSTNTTLDTVVESGYMICKGQAESTQGAEARKNTWTHKAPGS